MKKPMPVQVYEDDFIILFTQTVPLQLGDIVTYCYIDKSTDLSKPQAPTPIFQPGFHRAPKYPRGVDE